MSTFCPCSRPTSFIFPPVPFGTNMMEAASRRKAGRRPTPVPA